MFLIIIWKQKYIWNIIFGSIRRKEEKRRHRLMESWPAMETARPVDCSCCAVPNQLDWLLAVAGPLA